MLLGSGVSAATPARAQRGQMPGGAPRGMGSPQAGQVGGAF
ncbi:MAG: hypothetical protein AAF591_21835 [Verrucomicrobiota bacterium]